MTRLQAVHHLRLIEAAQSLVRLGEANRLPLLFFKGIAIDSEMLPKMADIDALVRKPHLNAWHRALTNEGYQWLRSPSRPVTTRFFEQRHYSSPSGAVVDLHVAFDSRWRWSVAYDQVWKTARAFTIGNVQALRLAPEEHTLAYTIQLAKDAFVRWEPALTRISAMIQESVSTVLLDRSQSWGTNTALWIAANRLGLKQIGRTEIETLAPADWRKRRIETLLVAPPSRRRTMMLRYLVPDTPGRREISLLWSGSIFVADAALSANNPRIAFRK